MMMKAPLPAGVEDTPENRLRLEEIAQKAYQLAAKTPQREYERGMRDGAIAVLMKLRQGATVEQLAKELGIEETAG